MEKILDVVNQNVQEALEKFQDTKNKEYEKTQKQINELIGALKIQCMSFCKWHNVPPEQQ
jgi:hypothetical protein